MFYNRDTGEIFETRAAAMADAAELYDFGDETNAATWDDMPYIEVEEETMRALARAFG